MKNHFYCLRAVVILFFLLSLNAAGALAQCNGFAKRSAAKLTPYNIDGTPHNVVLQSGDHAEISFTFFAGQSYRIFMNCEDAANGIVFFLRDSNRKLIFSSATRPDSGYYDFVSDITQQLTIEVIAKDIINDKAQETIASSCVSVMVGCKSE